MVALGTSLDRGPRRSWTIAARLLVLPLLEALLLKLTSPWRDTEVTLQQLLTGFAQDGRERLEVAQLVEGMVLFSRCFVRASNGCEIEHVKILERLRCRTKEDPSPWSSEGPVEQGDHTRRFRSAIRLRGRP
jgi:hypothetical protein